MFGRFDVADIRDEYNKAFYSFGSDDLIAGGTKFKVLKRWRRQAVLSTREGDMDRPPVRR